MEECIFDASQLLGRRFIDLIPAAVYVCDVEGRIRLYNRSAVELWGREPKLNDPHELYCGSLRLYHPDGRFMAHAESPMAEVLRTGRPLSNSEAVIERPDGSRSTVMVSIDPLRDEEGSLIGAVNVFQDITERKQAEAALRESEVRYRDLVENIQDLVCTHDLEGRVLSANSASASLLGYATEELVEMNIRDLLAPEARHMFDEYLASIQEEGQASGFMLVQSRSGEKRIWEYRNTLRTEGVAQPIVRGLARDVTEREQAETALRESEDRFRRLVQISPEAILVSCEGKVVFINPAGLKLFGAQSEDEILGRLVLECVHPDFREVVRQRMQLTHESDLPVPALEEKYIRLDGSIVHVEVIAVPFVWEGKPAGQVVVRDITDRKQAEEELHKSDQALRASHFMLQAIVEGTTDALFVKDLEGRYLTINFAGASMLGKSAQEIIGRKDDELFPQEVARGFQANDGRILASGESDTYEEVARMGELTRTFLTNKAPYRAADGSVIGVIGIAREITQLKLLEEELRQAQKMEAVGQLVNGIAHNFNNTLTAIFLFAGLLKSTLPSTGAQMGNLEEIERAAERASNLVSQLMTFSRKDEPVQQVLDLNRVLSDQARMIQEVIPENIELKISLGKPLGAARIDRGHVAEAVINLALNARDAMPMGGRLILETSNVTLDKSYTDRIPGLAPGPHVLLCVSDTGTGMDAGTKGRVFEPFFTTKPPGEGTGLGLAVVYATVKQNGGHVSVYSEEGMGTTFKIYLPAVSEEVEQKEVAADRPAGPEHVLAGNETILLVEDDRSIREPTREYLTQLGYQVLLAGDGQEALRVAQGHKPEIDLMLTDVVMPRMGGPELADQIKRVHPGIKVLFMSGYGAETLAGHLPTGSKALLRKPFSLEILAQRVRQAIGELGQDQVASPPA